MTVLAGRLVGDDMFGALIRDRLSSAPTTATRGSWDEYSTIRITNRCLWVLSQTLGTAVEYGHELHQQLLEELRPYVLLSEVLTNMSKSKKSTPVCGRTTASSEKQDKRLYNRRYRRIFRQAIHVDPTCELLPRLREYSNPWVMDKDGKVRFDPAARPELLRK